MMWPLLIAAAAAGAAAPTQPLHLDVTDDGKLLVISLVGESATPWTARYELEVTGGPSGGSSRSVQRGAAKLVPGRTTTVATVRLGNSAGEQWTAHLRVEPASGSPYETEWRSR